MNYQKVFIFFTLKKSHSCFVPKRHSVFLMAERRIDYRLPSPCFVIGVRREFIWVSRSDHNAVPLFFVFFLFSGKCGRQDNMVPWHDSPPVTAHAL